MTMAVFASLTAAAAVLVLGMSIVRYYEAAGVRRSLALVLRIGSIRPADPALAPEGERGWVGSVLESLSRALVLPRNRQRIKDNLGRAGRRSPEALQQTVERKVVYGFVGLLLGVLAIALWGPVGWFVALLAVTIGYFVPDLVVYNAGLRRTEQIRLTLPDAIDLLDLSVESGLSLQAAMSKVAQIQDTPVAEEFSRVLQEMRLGKSRVQAFEELAGRTTQEDLRTLISAILQADALGIAISSVLREQSREMRAKRTSRARELAQKVPVKILAPLMLCFFPGLFIIILGPAIITALDLFVRR